MFDVGRSMFISFLFDQNGCPLAGGRANMKLRGLLQKCSFFSPIRLAVFWPAAAARVKLKLKANRRKSNIEPQNVEGRMTLRFI